MLISLPEQLFIYRIYLDRIGVNVIELFFETFRSISVALWNEIEMLMFYLSCWFSEWFNTISILMKKKDEGWPFRQAYVKNMNISPECVWNWANIKNVVAVVLLP